MDPVSILGAAASTATVVQLCAQSLNALVRLQEKYRNVDMTIHVLITQLSTLRTALCQISEWVDSTDCGILNHVLPDLNLSLDGCRLLIEALNERLSRLEYQEEKGLSRRKRARAIWGEKERTEFLTMLGHNTAALQLLLTAMQCRSQSEQMVLLQSSASREIITKAQDDTSSLLWLRDDDSLGTRRSICTENSELLDLSFAFDREIFSSRAYITAMQSSMKHILRDARPKTRIHNRHREEFEVVPPGVAGTRTTTEGSRSSEGTAVDHHDSRQSKSATSIAESCERVTDNTSPDFRGSTASETPPWFPSGRQFVPSGKEDRNFDASSPGSRRLIRIPSMLKFRVSISSQSSLDTDLEPNKLVAYNEEKIVLIGNARDCGSAMIKSLELAYGQQREDMANEDNGIRETLISRKSAGIRYYYRFYDVVGLHSRENKWIYSFDKMMALVHIVDLAAYGAPVLDERLSSGVKEDLALFKQICSSEWLAGTPILLVLSNTDLLKSRISNFPLSDVFLDYNGRPTDLEAAKSFFRQSFLSLNQKYQMRVRIIFVDGVICAKAGKVFLDNVDKAIMEGTVLSFGSR